MARRSSDRQPAAAGAGRTYHAILPVTEFEEGVKVFMATANGTVKKTVLTEFNRLRTAGKVAIKLVDGDELIGVDLTSGGRRSNAVLR
ncbi:DNA gyrase subunit A [Escherichia coli]|nr:DNA gyrase subunit A [Escherichia coli]